MATTYKARQREHGQSGRYACEVTSDRVCCWYAPRKGLPDIRMRPWMLGIGAVAEGTAKHRRSISSQDEHVARLPSSAALRTEADQPTRGRQAMWGGGSLVVYMMICLNQPCDMSHSATLCDKLARLESRDVVWGAVVSRRSGSMQRGRGAEGQRGGPFPLPALPAMMSCTRT